jgi:hypothetical protein
MTSEDPSESYQPLLIGDTALSCRQFYGYNAAAQGKNVSKLLTPYPQALYLPCFEESEQIQSEGDQHFIADNPRTPN